MKKILFLLLSCTMLFHSCDNGMEDGLDAYGSILYFKDSGVVKEDVSGIEETHVFTYTVCKSGYDNTATADAAITPLTQEEIDAYNNENGTELFLLEQDYFSTESSVSFASNESYKVLELTLKVADIKTALDVTAKDYVVALKLVSDTKVNADKSIIIFKPEFPVFSLGYVGVDSEQLKVDYVKGGDAEQETSKTFNFEFSLDSDYSPSDFDVEFVTDDTELEALVSGAFVTGAQLLPVGNRELPSSVPVTDGYVKGYLTVNIKDINILNKGSYVLPIKMKSCSNPDIKIDSDIYYILVTVEQYVPGWKELTLSDDMFSGGNYEGNDRYLKLIDGDCSSENFWQSAWGNGSSNDETTNDYGLSINIDLGGNYEKIRLKYISFKAPDKAILSPSEIQFFGSVDETSWTELSDVITQNLPKDEEEWYISPVFDFFQYQYLKFAIRKAEGHNAKNQLKSCDYTQGAKDACVINELKIEILE